MDNNTIPTGKEPYPGYTEAKLRERLREAHRLIRLIESDTDGKVLVQYYRNRMEKEPTLCRQKKPLTSK